MTANNSSLSDFSPTQSREIQSETIDDSNSGFPELQINPGATSEHVPISRAIELHDDITNGNLTGQIRLYKTTQSDALEADAKAILDRTFYSGALDRVLTQFADSLRDQNPNGTFIFDGEYGAGKSHHLVALYHIFDSPVVAKPWLRSHGQTSLANRLPESTTTIAMAMQHDQPTNLWDPIGEELSGSLQLDNTQDGYPTVSDISTAIGDTPVVVFFDEIEDWYESLPEKKQAQTRGFLQALFEASNDPHIPLSVILSSLSRNSAINTLASRENAIKLHLETATDTPAIISHRLIESIDKERAEVGIKQYLDEIPPLAADDSLDEKLLHTYPFEPHLLHTLIETHQGNQSTRGLLRCLATVLKNVYEQSSDPLVLASGICPKTHEAFLSPLNPDLYTDIISDSENVTTTINTRVFNAIAIHSLCDSPINEGKIVRNCLTKSVNTKDIREGITSVQNTCPHLHYRNQAYQFRPEANAQTLVLNNAQRLTDAQARRFLKSTVEDLFGGNTYIHDVVNDDPEEIPDTRDLKLLIHPESWTEDEVYHIRSNDGQGRQYQNTFIWLEATENLVDHRTLDLAKRVRAAEQLRSASHVEGDIESALNRYHDNQQQKLHRIIKDRLGEFINPDHEDEDRRFWGYPLSIAIDCSDGESKYDYYQICDSMSGDQFQVKKWIQTAIDTILSTNKEQTTPNEIYNEFCRRTDYPLVASVDEIIANLDTVEGQLVAVHDDELRQDVTSVAEKTTELYPKETISEADLVAGVPDLDIASGRVETIKSEFNRWLNEYDIPDSLEVKGSLEYTSTALPQNHSLDNASIDTSADVSFLVGTTVGDVKPVVETLPDSIKTATLTLRSTEE